MDYEGFISTVREGAHIDDAEAERAACATLQTLAERLSTGEADDIAERLPAELRACLAPEDGGAQTFHVDEFLTRIAQRAGVDVPGAERDARAVFIALWRAVGPDEFADMRSELPKDFDPLLDDALRAAPPPEPEVGGPPDPPPSMDELVARVAERSGLDREGARRALDAVLEALADRISGGQVDDLERVLAEEARPPLERGRARSGGAARPLSLGAFLNEVAELAGAGTDTAAEHARAVLATLREAVGEKEWRDTVAQLPDGYRPLLAPQPT